MYWTEGSNLPQQKQSIHIHDVFQKIDPVTAVSTTPLSMKINELDSAIQGLATSVDETNQLLSQARAANIDPRVTMALQGDLEALRRKVLSLTADISMIREGHASMIQMQPLAPTPDMGMMPPGGMPQDPMMAAAGEQPPMNMPNMNGAGM